MKKWKFDKISLQLPTGAIPATGEIELSYKGEVKVCIQCSHFVPASMSRLSATGQDTKSGVTFQIPQGVIVRSSSDGSMTIKPLKTMIFYPVKDKNPIRIEHHLKNIKCYGFGSTRYGGSDVHLQPYPNLDINLVEPGQINAVLTIESSSGYPSTSVALADESCAILSMVNRCPIGWVMKEAFNASGEAIETHLQEVNKNFPILSPMTSFDSPSMIEFVEKSYQGYSSNLVSFGLNVLIDYYCRSHTETTAEVKYLFASIFMESFKFNWAANISGYQPQTKANGLIKGFKANPSDAHMQSFEQLLVGACNHIGFPAVVSSGGAPGTFSFIDDRNCIFHSGLSSAHQHGHPSSWPHIKTELESIFDQIDNILLRLVGYVGEYFPVSYHGHYAPKKIP
ncbi:MAG: hypothetical protein R3B45_01300 [Bdellovibrionota bacterium]